MLDAVSEVPRPERSGENLKPGQQLYGVIEFCNSPETLWAKLQSRHWDWLGVKRTKGRDSYVVGRPRVSRSEAFAAGTAIEGGTADGRHRTQVRVPHFAGVSQRWCLTAEAARLDYADKLEQLRAGGEGSGLFRITLIIDGQTEVEELVVRTRPNVL